MSSLRSALAAVRARPIPLSLGVIFFAQIYYFQWHSAYPNPNEVVRLYLSRAIVEEGTFKIDAMIRRFGDVEDKSTYKGHVYCDKAPGVSFAAVPVLALARLFGDLDMKTARHLSWLAVIALPSLLLLLALWRFFGRFGLGDPQRALLLLAFGLGSLHFTFSTLLFSHALAGILAMAALLVVSAEKRGGVSTWKLCAGGFAAGYAVITEYPVVIPLFFTFVYLCWGKGWRRAWIFALGGVLPIALWLTYNHLTFEKLIASGYGHVAVQFFARMHEEGFMGVTTPKWDALVGSFFTPSRGFFAYAPWLALALPGFVVLWRRRDFRAELWVALLTFVVYAYFISSFGYWVGGGTVGQRHLTPLVPFLLIPIAELLRRVAPQKEAEAPTPLTQPLLLASVDAMTRGLIAASIFTTVLASIPWPYVSPAYSNPLPQIALPMWRDGILPPSLGEALGLPVELAAVTFQVLLACVLLFVAFASAPVAWPRRLAVGGAAIAIAGAFVAVHARLQFSPGDESKHLRDRQGIARLVDPAGRRPISRAIKALEERERVLPLSPAEEHQLAALYALRGDTPLALRRYRAARRTAGAP